MTSEQYQEYGYYYKAIQQSRETAFEMCSCGDFKINCNFGSTIQRIADQFAMEFEEVERDIRG